MNEEAGINKEKSQIFVIQVLMSSQHQMLGSQEMSETQVLVDYKFKKEARRKIAAIRMRCKKPIYQTGLKFFNNYICTGEQQKVIIASIKEADKELQELDPSLHAEVLFMPIDRTEVAKGAMYERVISAIKFRILGDVIKRLEEKSGQLTKQSKEAMKRMIQRLKSVNVLNDPEIDKRLDEIYNKIITEDVEVIRTELQQELSLIDSRVGYIQL